MRWLFFDYLLALRYSNLVERGRVFPAPYLVTAELVAHTPHELGVGLLYDFRLA